MEQGEREVLMRQLEERRDIIDVYKRILGEVQAERDRCREALVALKGGDCWCEMAVGNPMVRRHSTGCQMATDLTKAMGLPEPRHGSVER
jgi:hypothetical protein